MPEASGTEERLPAIVSARKSPNPTPESGSAPVPAEQKADRIEIEPVEGEFGRILKRPGES